MARCTIRACAWTVLLLGLLSWGVDAVQAQPYLLRQTRHRFAQLNFGLDLEAKVGGSTQYFDVSGTRNSIDFQPSFAPRMLVGGTHFWGHADIYIAIPLRGTTLSEGKQEINLRRGVETVFKYYPWRIEHGKLRPFVGTSIAPFFYEQSNGHFEFGDGPDLNRTRFPVHGGLTFNSNKHLLELGVAWDYAHQEDYFISPSAVTRVRTPPAYLNLSYRFMIETTQSAEAHWESGQTQQVAQVLGDEGQLDGFYVGVGMSSAFWLGLSNYNQEVRPFLEGYSTSIMPEFTVGYYFNNLDLNLAASYRRYGSSTRAYGTSQVVRRQSVVFEASKFLFDYHGFVPFVGPAVSLERLGFEEAQMGARVYDLEERRASYGLTFGWDVRPDRLQSWILRTNLRWFPDLPLLVEPGREINFRTIEFNFIQLIVYPSRLFGKWTVVLPASET